MPSLILAALLLAAPAVAQSDPRVKSARGAQAPAPEEPAPEEGETAPSETEGIEVVQEGDEVQVGKEGARSEAPGEVHTVVGGDTLWDLSQKFLGSPWYWPKVWSYNPEIANPHWIYPGNLVRFFPSGEEVPTRVEVGASAEELSEPLAQVDADQGEVQLVGKIGYTPKNVVVYRPIGFVTRSEVEEAGKLEASFAEKEMLSFPDKVYLSFRRKSDARVGDNYIVYRTEREVRHPVTGESFGFMTQLLGLVKITSVSDTLVSGLVQETWYDIYRGDLVGPAGEQTLKNVSARPNEKPLKGRVVTTVIPHLTVMGEHQLLVIDRGGSDGVQPGNNFTVLRQNDPINHWLDPAAVDPDLPSEEIASCMAVDVKDKATVCILTRSIREVIEGDFVVTKPEVSPSEPRASLR